MKDLKRNNDADIFAKYQPTVVDAKRVRECGNILEVNGDVPALIIEHVDDWVTESTSGQLACFQLGTAVISWGVLALVPFFDICRGLVSHACTPTAEQIALTDRNAAIRRKREVICTRVWIGNFGMITIETCQAEHRTEVKLVRDLYIRPDVVGVS